MSTKFKILCFGRFYDDVPGGMQCHVENLFISLSQQVDFVHLVPSRDRNSAQFLLNDVPVIRTPSFNLDGSLALSPRLMYEAFKAHRYYSFDVVHLHFPDPMSHLASLFIPSSVPRVITWHCDVIRQKKMMSIYRPFLKQALEKSAAIVVATPSHISSSKELSQLKIRSKCAIIPFGFDLKRFVDPHPDVCSIRQRFPGKLIFALGRHVYYKGFDVLIRAMQYMREDTQLVLGGSGPLTEQLRIEAQECGVSSKVHFVGHILEEDLPAYYQACDIFCLPAVSQAEAFGIVQVEAMACGKAVVSTMLDNGVDYVNQHGVTGMTVPPNDVEALFKTISYLLENEDLRQELGERGKRRALTEFSLNEMGKSTLNLYKNIIKT